MRRCCVPGCRSNRAKPYISVFQFPKHPTKRDIWLQKIGLPSLQITENIGVCVKHFDNDYVVSNTDWKMSKTRKRMSIKKSAVPTIFEDPEDARPTESVKDSEKKEDEPITPIKPSTPAKKVVKSPAKPSPKKAANGLPSPYKHLPRLSVCLKEEDRVNVQKELGKVRRTSSTCSTTSSNSDVTLKSNVSSDATIQSSEGDAPDTQPSSVANDSGKAADETAESENKEVGRTTRFAGELKRLSTQDPPKPKKKKVEKPAPTVIGRKNDCFCWVCHKENVVLCCTLCPRAFHHRCITGSTPPQVPWICPECNIALKSEEVQVKGLKMDKEGSKAETDGSVVEKKNSLSDSFADMSLEKLCSLLRLCMTKMKHRAGVAFHQPVSLEHYPMYNHYVINPMDFSLLENNIKKKFYGCPSTFLADVKWIMHNSCVFNGSQHPLSVNAKIMVKACQTDMEEIEICPDCFTHSVIRNTYWFTEVCRIPHPLVWAKLKGFPYWPAKVARIAGGNIDARFFGAHDRAWVPMSQCYHLSKEMPTTSKPKKKGNYDTALDELSVHVELITQRFRKFEYAPYRTPFDPNNRHLMYHGIDVTKISKDENSVPDVIPNLSDSINDKDASNNERTSSAGMGLNDNSMELDNDSHSDKEDSVQDDNGETPETSKSTSIKEVCTDAAVQNSGESNKNGSPPKKPCSSDSSQLKIIDSVFQKFKGLPSLNKDASSKPSENQAAESNSLLDSTQPKTSTNKEAPAEEDSENNCSAILDSAKKNDLFTLKLSETIASCKAKLGISEVSISSEEDSDSGSGNEDEEDEADEEEEKDDREGEQVSENMENEDSSDEEESTQESSDTDIEPMEEDVPEVSTDEPALGDKSESVVACANAKDTFSKSAEGEVSDTTSKEAEAETLDTTLKVSEEDSSKPPPAEESPAKEPNTVEIDLYDGASDTEGETVVNTSPEKDASELSGLKNPESALEKIKSATQLVPGKDSAHVSTDKEGAAADSEDDIYICPTPKPPTPPLICLDDEADEEEDACAVKKPHPTPPRPVSLQPSFLKNAKSILISSMNRAKRRRSSSSEESSSSEDDVPLARRGLPLTGAKRTFNRPTGMQPPSQRPVLPPAVIRPEPVRSASVECPPPEVAAESSADVPESVQRPSTNPNAPKTELELWKQKFGKLLCRHRLMLLRDKQERDELQHNMKLMLLEMQQSMENQRKQSIEEIVQKLEREKRAFVSEVKKKQWCANCYQVSRYGCCWNTSYCSVSCQQIHFPQHSKVCSQLQKNPSSTIRISPPNISNNKVFLVNMQKDLSLLKSSPGASQQKQNASSDESHVKVTKSLRIVQPLNPTLKVFCQKLSPVKTDKTSTENAAKAVDKISSDSAKEIPNDVTIPSTSHDAQTTSDALADDKKNGGLLEEVPPSDFEGQDPTAAIENLLTTDDKSEVKEGASKEGNSPSHGDGTEMVSLGYGQEVSAAKYADCLTYGNTPQKLTRLLLSLMIPDEKMLASCTALGSQVLVPGTKLTRAALPNKKVNAIVEAVHKQFPRTQRGAIINTINKRCIEARSQGESKKTRLLQKLNAKCSDISSASETEQSPKFKTTITVPRAALPNLLRLAGGPPTALPASQGILHKSQVVLRPASQPILLPPVKKTVPVKAEEVSPIPQIVMPVSMLKPTLCTSKVKGASVQSPGIEPRSIIILGKPAPVASQATPGSSDPLTLSTSPSKSPNKVAPTDKDAKGP